MSDDRDNRDDDHVEERPRRRRPDDDEGEHEEERSERPRRRRRDDDDDDDRFERRRRRRREEEEDIGQDPAMRMLLPVGLSGWAIVSGYLGLFSVLCLPAPFAVLTGVLAIREIKRNPKKHGMGRATFGIVMGSLAIIVPLIFIALGQWGLGVIT
jgi:hypothetical protein